MYLHKNYIIFFCLLSIILGCQDITEPKKPENLVSSKKMEEIMYASALLNAAKGANAGQLSQTGIKPEKYIEEKFGVDSITYAENIAYYTTEIEQFLKMNERISKKLEKLHSEQDSLNKIDKAIKDSIRKAEIKKNKLDTTKVDSINTPILKNNLTDSDSIKKTAKKLFKNNKEGLLKNKNSLSKDSLELIKDGLKIVKEVKDSLERE